MSFCWVPSHSGFHCNEWADRAAKKGANHERESIALSCPLSISESYNLLEKESMNHIKILQNRIVSTSEKYSSSVYNFSNVFLKSGPHSNTFRSRQTVSLVYRFKLNAFKTKFVKGIKCCCGSEISGSHIIFECKDLKPFLPNITENSLEKVLNDFLLMFKICNCLLHSPVAHLL